MENKKQKKTNLQVSESDEMVLSILDSQHFLVQFLQLVDVCVQNVSIERLMEVCEALKDNTVCIHFHMAGVAANDKVGKVTVVFSTAKHNMHSLSRGRCGC